MRRLVLIMFAVVSCAAFASQDSLQSNVITYADTFKITQEAKAVGDEAEEQILLDLLHRQALLIKAHNDSVQAVQDSILHADSTWLALQDSLRVVAQLRREQELRDSIAREEEELRRLKSQLIKAEELHHDTTLVETDDNVKALMEDAEEDRQRILRSRKGYGPWYKLATGLVQFSQGYVSGNWHQGGNSSFAMYANVKGIIKYDAKKWVTWENTGEWQEGFSTALGDSLRKINMTDDVFKIYSKLNVRIKAEKLYGSFSIDFQTPFFNTWKENTNTLKTGTFTPIRFNWALGVDYKPIKNMSMVFAPLAYKLVYAKDTINVDRSVYGINSGNMLSTFGSSVRFEWKWRPLREIYLETVFYAYTNYKMFEVDWEITCDFIINRYMSARVMLHPRYDSSAIVEGDTHAKMQFKELISIGFAHKFY
ncbi:MAG: DUF3078 domain-containing protein [Paludibacteraceae bacterium]|nr:DUF3078 domain-containing protein [Paludibacteraceae bacterium]